jgi:hypothetical protein
LLLLAANEQVCFALFETQRSVRFCFH